MWCKFGIKAVVVLHMTVKVCCKASDVYRFLKPAKQPIKDDYVVVDVLPGETFNVATKAQKTL